MAKIEEKIIDDINIDNNFASKQLNSDIIPYACYYDENTIITQNGELLSTIKIPSFIANKSKDSFYNLRKDLTETCKKHSRKNNNINFWFQTIRLPVNMIPKNQNYDDYIFSNKIIDKWNNFYKWDNQYANEIYITIIIAPEEEKTSSYINFLKAINFSLLKGAKVKEMAKMSKTLSNIVKNILEDLKSYAAELLTIRKINNTYYSDHLKFFSMIINGEKKDIKLPVNELSNSLTTRKVAYGKNLIQLYNKTDSHYVAIISLKYCNNIFLSILDKIIQLNQEMIITQSITFIDEKPINDEMMKYFEILNLNEDDYILNNSEIGEMLPDKDKEDGRICLSQVLIKLKSNTKEGLEKNVETMFNILNKIGFVAVREEMFMPTLFWSQLPANFNFVKRFQKIPVDNLCNFTSLFNFPVGKISNNHWGDAILVLKTALETPYFFSFHNEKNGNTLIIGPKHTKKTRYLNLFLMSATKQIKKLIYIDNTNRSKVFINSLNGKYYFITRQESKKRLYINPFQLEKTQENIDFILEWLYTIIKNYDDGMVAIENTETNLENEWQKLKEILNNRINNISKIGDVLDIAKNEKLEEITEALSKWASPTGYGFLFNEDNRETLDLYTEENIIGINLNTIINNEELKIAIFQYIIHNILQKTNGEPTILAIDESWLLFDNKYFAKNLSNITKKLYDKNVAIVATTSGADSYETSNIQSSVRKLFPTNILLPNLKTPIYQRKIFNINEEESRILSLMKEENNNILIKNSKDTIITSIDFNFLTEEEKRIFSCSNLDSNIMTKAKELINSTDVKDWLPLMFELVKKYEKIKFEEKQKEQERRQIKWEEVKQTKGAGNILKEE